MGAFNVFNMETAQAVTRASYESKTPCVIQVTPSTFRYTNPKTIGQVVRGAIENESNGDLIGFHLDHGKNFDDVVSGVEDAGMDSVMIDASLVSFRENLKITQRVVEYAHARGVMVQAELGKVPYIGREKQVIDWDELMTNPEEAKQLVEEAKIDALAVGVGNAHGFFPERPEPDWERLKKIRELIPNTPLIMHGASDWTEEKIKKAINLGVNCFNIDTDNRVAFMTAICNSVGNRCDITDPRKLLDPARQAVCEKTQEKMKIFGSFSVSKEEEPKDGSENFQTFVGEE